MIKDRHIILGVTGGIAAYKAAEITSRLKKAGAKVHVILTKAAQNFITELTFRELSGLPVNAGMWERAAEWQTEHIALADQADLALVAPATANLIAKVAAGIADDMLTTVLLATDAPIFIAPAMNSKMYLNPATQKNIAELKRRGIRFIEPDSGLLACGAKGVGRLREPSEIVGEVEKFFDKSSLLKGKKIIVTAGGTIAPIDPVRFIGNHSGGKMGFAVAKAAAARGANVTLIAGRTDAPPPPEINTRVTLTTQEMYEAVTAEFADADAVIKTAAVADYRVKNPSPQKIKKGDGEFTLELVRNPDILYELGQRKNPRQILVGFAAETENLAEYAKKKISKKNLDFIVANNVAEKNAGFKTDTNIATIFFADGREEKCGLMSKNDLADIILNRIEDIYSRRQEVSSHVQI